MTEVWIYHYVGSMQVWKSYNGGVKLTPHSLYLTLHGWASNMNNDLFTSIALETYVILVGSL